MDQFVLDLGDDAAAVGDEVVLFGPGDDGEPTAQDWADATGTISYEIVTRVGPRVPRVYVGATLEDRRDRLPTWGQRAAVVAGAAGVVAAGAAVGLAAERYAVGRSFRGARTPRPTSRSASCAARVVPVTADDGVPLHVEVDGPPPSARDAAGDGRVLPRSRAQPGQLALPAARPADLADDGAGWCSGTSAGTAGPAAGRPRTRRSTSSAATCARVHRRRPRRTGPLVLVGHSMGGMTIMALADQQPELFGDRVIGVALVATSPGRLAEVTLRRAGCRRPGAAPGRAAGARPR